jgi:hypothetical protein
MDPFVQVHMFALSTLKIFNVRLGNVCLDVGFSKATSGLRILKNCLQIDF